MLSLLLNLCGWSVGGYNKPRRSCNDEEISFRKRCNENGFAMKLA